MQWTDRIRQVKIWLVVVAIIITAVSLYESHRLVSKLQAEEHTKMEIWAEAMRVFTEADEDTDLSLVSKVIEENSTIPVVVLSNEGEILDYSNIEDTTDMVRRMLTHGDTIRISDYQLLCFEESTMLKQLTLFPYWALGLATVFIVVAIFALLVSKRAEQNKVWVGLSKETAHQLGTPISSLIAWVEVLKETYPDDEMIPEMSKDVNRLERIAERFSKIGSLPEPVNTSLNEVIDHVIEYMDKRTSQKVTIKGHYPNHPVIAKINASLFEWVFENLCKNAVDAMESGSGKIDIWLLEEEDIIAIELVDTGKGIRKKDIKNVFRPGFTTKKRGWGLGLSLAKRIVEEYHKGHIYVKKSELGRGTTFRIELKAVVKHS
ncbi:MAG: HAMP domain-containing histidine kinase [Prevotella sp.]|nr:HAMP domain-containing histidine kinase [Prevotella sp.]